MADQVTIAIDGGPTIVVAYVTGMTAHAALEAAWNQEHDATTFTYGLQYYGSELGYLVFMVNETYDTFLSVSEPFFYWEFSVNGTPASQGIDQTVLSDGDVVGFAFTTFDAVRHAGTLLERKHEHQLVALTPAG
jgi:hypothetical protein